MLLGSGDDFFLQVAADIYEVVTETSHPYDEVTMLFGVPLRFSQGLGADYVELHVMAVELEIGPNEVDEFIEPFAVEDLWVEFHI